MQVIQCLNYSSEFVKAEIIKIEVQSRIEDFKDDLLDTTVFKPWTNEV
jgi:hypothetical protein